MINFIFFVIYCIPQNFEKMISNARINSKGSYYIGMNRKVIVFSQERENMFCAKLVNRTYNIFSKIQMSHNKVNSDFDNKFSNSNKVSVFSC